MNIKQIFALCALALLSLAVTAQEKSSGAEPEPIPTGQEFVVSFHRPVVTAGGQLKRISGTDTVEVEKALGPDDLKKGFKVNDRVVIRVNAPVDCFVYVVNNSKWDGSVLTNNGEALKKGAARDFIYRLTNRKSSAETGFEELIFLFRRTAFAPNELGAYLTKQNGTTLPLVKTEQPTFEVRKEIEAVKAQSKKGVIIKVGCEVASFFFPWVKKACTLFKLSGAEPEGLPNNQTALKTETETENMIVQFAFPVTP